MTTECERRLEREKIIFLLWGARNDDARLFSARTPLTHIFFGFTPLALTGPKWFIAAAQGFNFPFCNQCCVLFSIICYTALPVIILRRMINELSLARRIQITICLVKWLLISLTICGRFRGSHANGPLFAESNPEHRNWPNFHWWIPKSIIFGDMEIVWLLFTNANIQNNLCAGRWHVMCLADIWPSIKMLKVAAVYFTVIRYSIKSVCKMDPAVIVPITFSVTQKDL